MDRVDIPDMEPCPICRKKVFLIVNEFEKMRLFFDTRDINDQRYYLRETVKIECSRCGIRTGEWVAEVEVDPKTMQTSCSLLETENVRKLVTIWNSREPESSDKMEVVRCENCRHGQRSNIGQPKGYYICEYDQQGELRHPRHYCGYGKRYETT